MTDGNRFLFLDNPVNSWIKRYRNTQAENESAIRFFTEKGFQNPTPHVYMILNQQK